MLGEVYTGLRFGKKRMDKSWYDAKSFKVCFCLYFVCICMCAYVIICTYVCAYAHEDYCVHVEIRWEKNLKFVEVCSFQCLEFDDQRPSSFVS